jgi:hypothetical protein
MACQGEAAASVCSRCRAAFITPVSEPRADTRANYSVTFGQEDAMGHMRMAAVMVLCLAWLAGCTDTTSSRDTSATQVAAAAQTAKLGETVTQKDMALTVWKVDDPAPANNEAAQPAAGTRWVALDIQVQNLGARPHDYDLTLYALIRATDNYEYRALKLGVVQPAITPVQVAAGSSQRGWLTFQLPQDKRPDYFRYAPSDGSGVRITVSLTR